MRNVSQDLTTLEITQLGASFNRINRGLFAAQSPQEWTPAVEEMTRFLAVVDEKVLSDLALIAGNAIDSSRAFSMLLTVIALGTQYRHEQYKPKGADDQKIRNLIDEVYLPLTGAMRKQAIDLAKKYLAAPVFDSLREAIDHEILPLLDSMDFSKDPHRWMPFRVVQIANIYERLYGFRLRTSDPLLIGDSGHLGLLRMIYDRKYLRFGTSGVRARWGNDFTEQRARQVVQAVCDFMNDSDVPDFVGRENLAGKKVVIGYDTRRNADLVAEWAAEVCLANGFEVEFAARDTPTPALVYYLTDYLKPEDVAGLLICTASHNPTRMAGNQI